jgi:hypothetical protein
VLDHGVGGWEEKVLVLIPPADQIRRRPVLALNLDDLAVALLVALVTPLDREFSPGIERSLNALPQVSATEGIRSGIVQLYGKTTPVVATDPVKASQLFNIGVTQGRLASMTPSGIAVSTQVASGRHLGIGSPVTLTYPATGRKTYTVQVIYSVRELAGDYVLPLAAAQANFPQALDIDVFVKLAPGISAGAGRHAIQGVLAAYPNVTLVVAALAGLAGIAAAIAPGRGAARLDVLHAVTTE